LNTTPSQTLWALAATIATHMPIKRRYIKHGDIVELTLPNLKRFGYGKIIDPRLIAKPLDYPHFIRVYDASFEQPILSLDALRRELLVAPFYIVGGSAAITKFNWKILDNEHVQKEEEWIPDTKVAWPCLAIHLNVGHTSNTIPHILLFQRGRMYSIWMMLQGRIYR